MTFNPDDAAAPGSGIFGLPTTRDEARVVVMGVPFDATTSYRPGTADGPSAIFDASMQVDLFDRRYGRIYEAGISMDVDSLEARRVQDDIRAWSTSAAALARPLIERGGGDPSPGSADRAVLDEIDALCDRVREAVRAHTRGVLGEGKIPGLLGGEHAVSLGAIEAAAEKGPIGILQIDAHMDLRDAFEGFARSHASIMHNVLNLVPKVERLVQVGIRDFGEGELEFARSQGARVSVHFDDDLRDAIQGGTRLTDLWRRVIEPLPDRVYVSFDIDGLDPSLCPHTGTPVPGGLSFHEAATLLKVLSDSGRRVVGFDLVEVAPGPNADEPEWDANVGARMLYQLCGCAVGGR